MELEDRKKRILEAIIRDYIETAEPVGSRTITKKYDLGVSPATVRNEMADLEDLGLIEQPHTSAGRIPSQIGYRYYVDYLMKKETLTSDIKDYIHKSLEDQINAKERLIKGTVKLLSQITNYTSVLILPTCSANKLVHIKMLPLVGNRMVLIMVLDNGHVEHQVVETTRPISKEDCDDISSMLSAILGGKSPNEWKEIDINQAARALNKPVETLQEVCNLIEDNLTVNYEKKLYLSGTMNIMNQPEFQSLDRVQSLLSLLEEEQIIEDLMQKSSLPSGINIRIGSENDNKDLQACSLVTATYQLGGKVLGTVGVLGPTRMKYSRTAGILDYVSHLLEQGLND